jgi:single-strand DNA-binding protein
MATTITGKLNKAANQFQASESVGFNINVGVRYYDRETKSDQWTNYSAVVFAKAPAQVKFYQQVLVEGAVVEVSGDKQRIKQYQGQNGLSLSIELLDAKLGFVFAPQSSANQAQAPQQQRPQAPHQPQQQYSQAPQQPQYQQGMHNGQPAVDFDSNIPF